MSAFLYILIALYLIPFSINATMFYLIKNKKLGTDRIYPEVSSLLYITKHKLFFFCLLVCVPLLNLIISIAFLEDYTKYQKEKHYD